MKFRLILYSKAAKFYNKLDNKTVKKLNHDMERLESNPFSGKGIKKLKGNLSGKYRLRVGELRVVYFVEDQTVVVETIARRKDVYQ